MSFFLELCCLSCLLSINNFFVVIKLVIVYERTYLNVVKYQLCILSYKVRQLKLKVVQIRIFIVLQFGTRNTTISLLVRLLVIDGLSLVSTHLLIHSFHCRFETFLHHTRIWEHRPQCRLLIRDCHHTWRLHRHFHTRSNVHSRYIVHQ